MRYRLVRLAVAALLLPLLGGLSNVAAQGVAQTGTISGRVVDDQGGALAGVQVYISAALGTQTHSNGEYILTRVPEGTQTLHARLLGYRPEAATVAVSANQTATQNFTMRRDPLQLQTLVVTGTQTPRMNLDASVAVTSLTPTDIQRAVPRSTSEVLRYVPGFTRVESSGGEVNENYSVRGILGVEYVNFLEDGLPVFPTMHTYFMNADNLIRFDENVERLEIVRGGASALFGSNTPGAMLNLLNKTGGDEFGGAVRATGATEGLARLDMNANGPLGDAMRFNVGGFYRYDHGVRDPGFPGIRGGQVKASVTRLLSNGYIRLSAKVIDDRNQFILDLPFTNQNDPQYVPGFGDYGSFNSPEALNLRVPTPTGDLDLPLDNGLRTKAQWYTADASFDLTPEWHLQNTAQWMQDQQEWNALVPSNALPASDFATAAKGQGGLGLPAGTTVALTYTNQFDANGTTHLPFTTPNGLVAPGQLIHVSKPLSAIQDQFQLRRTFGKHTLSFGTYIANYTQDNHWFFTQILTDVGDQTHFLDAVVTPAGGGAPDSVTKNGFVNQLSGYTNGSGQTSIISGVLGGEIQLTDQLRADVGVRGEYDKYVQVAEQTSAFDLDLNPATTYNNETFGNGSFRHFTRGIKDWSASLGLNYALQRNLSLYAAGARGYKMPALDEFLQASAQQQVNLFESRQVQSVEGGVKGFMGPFAFTVGGFWTKLKNVVSQGLVIDPVTGASAWVIQPSPENKSYGAELELVVNPVPGFQLLGAATLLKAELGSGAGADIGSRLNGVPTSIANAAALYTIRDLQLKADWHWVDKRPTAISAGPSLPAYSYFNLGAGFNLSQGTTINADLLNAFQGKGLEEGNPRVVSTGGIFLARPILPRRFQVSVRYDLGGGGTPR
ncbi:MAG TPA: TonB-dependent receptor [Gemmatimonadales bacterium]|nr:TonB-dependent receptor [Gemmatimonadales bacterium]